MTGSIFASCSLPISLGISPTLNYPLPSLLTSSPSIVPRLCTACNEGVTSMLYAPFVTIPGWHNLWIALKIAFFKILPEASNSFTSNCSEASPQIPHVLLLSLVSFLPHSHLHLKSSKVKDVWRRYLLEGMYAIKPQKISRSRR